MSGDNTTTIVVDDQGGGLYWTGAWTKCDASHQEDDSSVDMSLFSNSTYTFTTTANDTIKISWLGAGIIAYGTKSTDGSWYSWAVDGGQWSYEESWAASLSLKQKLVNLPQLTYGTHELVLRNSRDVNVDDPGRTGRIRLSVDYFELNGQQLKYDDVVSTAKDPSTSLGNAAQYGASIGPTFESATPISPSSVPSSAPHSLIASSSFVSPLQGTAGITGGAVAGGYQTRLQGGIQTGLTPNFQIPTDIAKYAANGLTSAAGSSFHTQANTVPLWAFVGLFWVCSHLT